MKNNSLVLVLMIFTFLFSCTKESEVAGEDNKLNNLNFTEIYSFDENFLEGISMGFTGSSTDNTLYISSRDEFPFVNGTNREQIIKLDLNTNSHTEKTFLNSDFISKRLFIKDSKLQSLGGQFINAYDLDIINDPISINHGRILSKFNITNSVDDNMLVIGGDFSNTENSNKIYKWNTNSPQNFIEFASVPQKLYGTDGVILADSLYLFGGSTDGSEEPATSRIYKVNVNDPANIQEFDMNINVNKTFVQKSNDLIIIAGQKYIWNQGVLTGKRLVLGKFNVETNEFQEITHNLDNSNGFKTIGQMYVMNDKIYIVYGDYEFDAQNEFHSNWSIFSADLN